MTALRALLAALLLLAVPAAAAVTTDTMTVAPHADPLAADGDATAVRPGEPGHGQGHGGGGMPQLDPSSFASQIFWLAVSMGVLYRLLSRRALPRIAQTLDGREARLRNDLDRATQARAGADAARERHEQVLTDARTKAAAEAQALRDRLALAQAQRQSELDRDLAAKLAEAQGRLGAQRDAALAGLEEATAGVVQTAVRRLAGIDVGLAEARRAVADAATSSTLPPA